MYKHKVEECEMFKEGIAYRLHLPEVPGLPGYTQERGVVFCEIKEGHCLYKQEGKRIMYTSSKTGLVCICNSEGSQTLHLKNKPKGALTL